MDGNGRWAKSRGLPRLEGHRAGAKSVRKVVEECRRLGVRYLTLYSFSSENWARSEGEVGGLMSLLRHYLDAELETLLSGGVRLRAIGQIERLPADLQSALKRNIERTANLEGMELILALSYGGREEIVSAVKRVVEDVEAGSLRRDQIDGACLSERLWTSGIPDPDLLIRSSGELRISNFLLWQLAYTEIVVVPEMWPEFDEAVLHHALEEYGRRERRFGMTSEQIATLRSGDR